MQPGPHNSADQGIFKFVYLCLRLFVCIYPRPPVWPWSWGYVASCLAVFDRILFPKSRGRLYRLEPLLSLYHILNNQPHTNISRSSDGHLQLLFLAIVPLVNSLSERTKMAVLGNSDFSRYICVEKSRKKTYCCYGAYYDCICVLGLGWRHWEVFLLNHVRWGCFVVTVSECMGIGVCVRKSVHHLSIAGACIICKCIFLNDHNHDHDDAHDTMNGGCVH